MASEVGVDPYDHISGSPPEISKSGKKSWDELRKCVRDTRKLLTTLVSSVPTSFTFRNISTEDGAITRLYFLGVPIKGRENTLLYVDLPSDYQDYVLPWQQLLDSFQPSTGQLSREEQLLRERKRLGIYGITSYDLVENEGKFIFPACNSLFTCVDSSADSLEEDQVVLPISVTTNCTGARLDPKICPADSNLVSFIHNGDIWVSHLVSGQEKRLTFVHKGEGGLADDPIVAGVPSFVVQEEFDRYTGYWWLPTPQQTSGDVHIYRILYEEVDESEVEILSIFAPTPTIDSQGVDEFRYPRAGTANARSTLKILEFEVDRNGAFLETVTDRQMLEPLTSFCPWLEYIVRAGPTSDSKYVYAQVMDRQQQQLALILLPVDYFMPLSSDIEMSSFDNSSYPPLQIIYRETSDVWINVHDILHFFPQSSPDEVSFLWSSEKTGYRHLYHVTSRLQTPPSESGHAMELEDRFQDSPGSQVVREVAVTQGSWEVQPKQIWVDEIRNLVYFIGLKDTPLETHLYCVSYDNPGEPVRLTQLGYSHTVSLDKSCSLFVSVYSSLQYTPRCKVFRISHGSSSHQIQADACGTVISSTSCPEYKAPELFEFPSNSGYTLHGMYYRPHNYEPGMKYPTVLFVYGGPQVQLVTNAFKGLKFLRLHTLASQGYAVVTIDGRGSCNRGLDFESLIKGKLGTVEMTEQVEGLLWLAHTVDFIDTTRVAIHGWSYGGYLSLMGLAQKPDIFKVAIAGAPVVSWNMYDTGYTERYLDLPDINSEGYHNGSVLSYIDKFPDQENRLLIIHGLIDENVHFHHTSHLVSALVKACKPYQLQVYPNERHGIRNHESSEHYKTMILSFLQNNL